MGFQDRRGAHSEYSIGIGGQNGVDCVGEDWRHFENCDIEKDRGPVVYCLIECLNGKNDLHMACQIVYL